ncbi:RidA family protein [Hymenobacter jeollabukensis]|uniref:RidA family protein n=1 Tax=Hymenobacter jeollabukensis TaxID=2025313 RepID=A0A5R8WWG7_9BACT|nr:RidA family protein [Hymenobacter jeollabukensis]TLM96582.1 RidA family protein [Hymenobacter jeollabukensis]
MSILRLNPADLFQSPAFSQAIVTQGPGRTIYVGGQNAVDAQGQLVGSGDLTAQTRQALLNVQTALEAAGAGWAEVVRLGVYLVQGQDVQAGFKAAQEVMGPNAAPPTITVLFVAALGRPEYLVEIEATAFVEG